MKLYNKIGIFALAIAGLNSCAVNDPFADNMQIGQQLPTVAFELGSTVCKAGSDVSFTGKYYFDATDMTSDNIDHSEMWALISRSESAAATCKLTSSYALTKTVTASDTVRSSQLVKRYEHKTLEWNAAKTIADYNKVYVTGDQEGAWEDEGGKYNSDYHIDRTNLYEYALSGSIPTSQTLSTVNWVNPGTWDEDKFNTYYPEGFQKEFVDTIVSKLTKDSLYIADLRHVYINYDFTAEQFAAAGTKYGKDFPTTTDTGEKSDKWFTNTEKVVGKYYITIDGNGKSIIHEVAVDAVVEGVTLYDVYESAPWVFCRYSDDTGAPMTSVRADWMPLLKDLISQITFTEWIYDSADKVYTVTFKRDYKMYPVFKVYGTNGKVGYSTDEKEISLN